MTARSVKAVATRAVTSTGVTCASAFAVGVALGKYDKGQSKGINAGLVVGGAILGGTVGTGVMAAGASTLGYIFGEKLAAKESLKLAAVTPAKRK